MLAVISDGEIMPTKKEVKRTRMSRYFVEAAAAIIRDEGIDGITIRKVADRAGYNSATLYNYFENLDHLVFLASFRFLQPYASQVGECTSEAQTTLERYLMIWDLFCRHSFRHADIYQAIFFAQLNSPFADYITEYYQLYPEDLPPYEDSLSAMISSPSIYDRTHILLLDCVEEGFFQEDDLAEITEMTVLLYKGMLSRFLEQSGEPNREQEQNERLDGGQNQEQNGGTSGKPNREQDGLAEAWRSRTMKYIRVCCEGYLQRGKRGV